MQKKRNVNNFQKKSELFLQYDVVLFGCYLVACMMWYVCGVWWVCVCEALMLVCSVV